MEENELNELLDECDDLLMPIGGTQITPIKLGFRLADLQAEIAQELDWLESSQPANAGVKEKDFSDN